MLCTISKEKHRHNNTHHNIRKTRSVILCCQATPLRVMQAGIHYGYTFSHTHVHTHTHSYTYALIAKRSHMKLLTFNSEHYIQGAEQNSQKGNILFSFIFMVAQGISFIHFLRDVHSMTTKSRPLHTALQHAPAASYKTFVSSCCHYLYSVLPYARSANLTRHKCHIRP